MDSKEAKNGKSSGMLVIFLVGAQVRPLSVVPHPSRGEATCVAASLTFLTEYVWVSVVQGRNASPSPPNSSDVSFLLLVTCSSHEEAGSQEQPRSPSW